jgi:transposase
MSRWTSSGELRLERQYRGDAHRDAVSVTRKGGGSMAEYDVFVGVDWGSQTHQVCALDAEEQRLLAKAVPHSGDGLAALGAELSGLATDPARIAVALEMPRGAVVDAMLERGFQVFALNPKQLDRFRDRHSVAGAKDDSRDAFVLAAALRTDRPRFRRVAPDDARVVELRELSRVDDDLGQEILRLSNRLREQLQRFFPQALALCPAANEPWFWALLEQAPTPAAARQLSAKRITAILKTHRIRRLTVEPVRAALEQTPLVVAPGTVAAATTHIALLLPRLRLVHHQRAQLERRLETLLEELATEPGEQLHRGDVTILRSLPGVGTRVAATMLAEAARLVADRDYQSLRAYAGVAPVTRQSGKTRLVSMRYACNLRLRNALSHWARTGSQRDAHTRAHYTRLRQAGHDHERALRGVGDRLLTVLMAMLQTGTTYDPGKRRAAA